MMILNTIAISQNPLSVCLCLCLSVRLAESRTEPVSDNAALSPQEVSEENLLSIHDNDLE